MFDQTQKYQPQKFDRRGFIGALIIACTIPLLPKSWGLALKKWWEQREIAQFKRISIPLVRRIYPSLIANKIVSVQPMQGPAGLIYYLRYKYSNGKLPPGVEPNDLIPRKP